MDLTKGAGNATDDSVSGVQEVADSASSKPIQRKTRQHSIRDAILADRTKQRTSQNPIGPCFTCGRSFVQTEDRFCSDRCRESFDNGARPYEPPLTSREIMERFPVSDKILGQGNRGAFIICPGCNTRFESIGLRHCSKECRDKKRNSNSASIGIEYEDRRKSCQAEGCTNRIPLFRKGRAVSKATRYCSSACTQRARKAANGLGQPEHVLDAPNDKKAPDFIGLNEAVSTIPINILGGGQRFTGKLDRDLRREIIASEIGCDVVMPPDAEWIDWPPDEDGA